MHLNPQYYRFVTFLIICYFSLISKGLTNVPSSHATINSSENDNKKKEIKNHTINVGATGTMTFNAADKIYVFTQNIGYKYNINKMEFNGNASWRYGSKLSGLMNNDIMIVTDANYFLDDAANDKTNRNSKYNVWFLGTFTSSYSLNILDEYQAGIGLAWKITDSNVTSPLMIRVSNGIILENSHFINKDGKEQRYNTVRNSFRLQWNMYFIPLYLKNSDIRDAQQRKIKYLSTLFWQPSLNKPKDYNLRINASLQFPIIDGLSFEAKYGHEFATRTDRKNTVITYGINYTTKF